MRLSTTLLALGLTAVHATELTSFVSPGHPGPLLALEARQSCLSNERSCGPSGCIPSSASCCSTVEGTFCPSGYYCDTGGCCEDGERCSGNSGACPKGSERCGLDCVLPGECTTGGSGGSGGGSGSGSGSFSSTTSTRSTSTRTRTSTSSTPTFDFGTSTTSTSSPTRTPGGSGGSGSGANGGSFNSGSGLTAPINCAILGVCLAIAAM